MAESPSGIASHPNTVNDLRHVLELTEPKMAIVSSKVLAERVLKANVDHGCLSHLMLMDKVNDLSLGNVQQLAWPSNTQQVAWPDVASIKSDHSKLAIYYFYFKLCFN